MYVTGVAHSYNMLITLMTIQVVRASMPDHKDGNALTNEHQKHMYSGLQHELDLATLRVKLRHVCSAHSL